MTVPQITFVAAFIILLIAASIAAIRDARRQNREHSEQWERRGVRERIEELSDE